MANSLFIEMFCQMPELDKNSKIPKIFALVSEYYNIVETEGAEYPSAIASIARLSEIRKELYLLTN